MSNRIKVLLAVGVVFGTMLILAGALGSEGKNEEFQPQDAFKLEPWIALELGPLDLSINKAVLYLVLSTGLTIGAMLYISKRMQQRPNRVQTAVETVFVLMRDNITRGNMPDSMAIKWFPFIGALFLFIWISNLIGYIPLPTSADTVNVFGLELPSFALYAATANISVTLALTLMVWIGYHIVGVRAQGVGSYLGSWIPEGSPGGPMKGGIFAIEVISQFVRIISLSVRLFANILAGHLLILFMGGGLVVLLGVAALGALTLPIAIAFFLFEVVLIATLQAFIFATLTAIYITGATGAH